MIKTLRANQKPSCFNEHEHLKRQTPKLKRVLRINRMISSWCGCWYSNLYSYSSWCERAYLLYFKIKVMHVKAENTCKQYNIFKYILCYFHPVMRSFISHSHCQYCRKGQRTTSCTEDINLDRRVCVCVFFLFSQGKSKLFSGFN